MQFTHNLARPGADVPGAYETDGLGDPYERMVYAHYFAAGANGDWYVLEYDRTRDALFGWCEILPGCGELGWAGLQELEDVCIQLPLMINDEVVARFSCRIEKDTRWVPRPLSQVLKERNS